MRRRSLTLTMRGEARFMEAKTPGRPRSYARKSPLKKAGTSKGGKSGLGPSQNQGMDSVGAFISIDRLQIHQIAHHVIIAGNAVGAMHVARASRNLKRLAGIVAFDQADGLRRQQVLLHEPARLQTGP